MVALGDANSRMKDFYDVWVCSRHLDFNAGTLLGAIDATFRNRGTPIPDGEFEALTKRFAEHHRVQWNAFVRKIGAGDLADEFEEIVHDLTSFTSPLLRALARNDKFSLQWTAGKRWASSQ